MNDPTNQTLIIRPKADAYEHEEGGTSTSIVGAFPSKVEFVEGEGYLMWFPDCKYPLAGLLDPVALASADRIKKYLKTILKILSSPPFIFASVIAALLPMKGMQDRFLNDFSEFCLAETKEFTLKQTQYTRAVQEFRRAMLLSYPDPVPSRIVKAIALSLEHDRKYRYMAQDALERLDKEALQKNPAKEVRRIINLLVEREIARPWKQKEFRAIGMLAYIMIKLRPEIRRVVISIGKELNIEKIKMDTKDKYWSYLDKDYNFGGLPLEERKKIFNEL